MGTASIGPSAGAEAAEAEEETTAMAEEGPEEEASDRVEAAAADSEEAEVRIFEGKKLDYGNVRSKMNVWGV